MIYLKFLNGNILDVDINKDYKDYNYESFISKICSDNRFKEYRIRKHRLHLFNQKYELIEEENFKYIKNHDILSIFCDYPPKPVIIHDFYRFFIKDEKSLYDTIDLLYFNDFCDFKLNKYKFIVKINVNIDYMNILLHSIFTNSNVCNEKNEIEFEASELFLYSFKLLNISDISNLKLKTFDISSVSGPPIDYSEILEYIDLPTFEDYHYDDSICRDFFKCISLISINTLKINNKMICTSKIHLNFDKIINIKIINEYSLYNYNDYDIFEKISNKNNIIYLDEIINDKYALKNGWIKIGVDNNFHVYKNIINIDDKDLFSLNPDYHIY